MLIYDGFLAKSLAGNITLDSAGFWTPERINNVLQWYLDGEGYSNTTLQNYPVLTPKETGTLAVPRGQRCALFDGVNDFGTLGARLTTGSPTALCGSTWIKTTGNTSQIMGEYDSSSSIRSWAMNVSATGKLQVLLSVDGGNTNFKNYSSATSVNTGSWFHVAFTFIAGTLTLYVNGAAETPTIGTDGPVASLFNTTAHFAIGVTNTGGGTLASFFNGSMRDVRVYNVAKSPSEIAAIYNQHLTPSTIDTAGLLGMWPMQSESGTIGYDVSGNGRHLTLTNITQSTFHAVDSGVNWNYNNWRGHTVANNLLTFSEQFDNGAWAKFNTTVTGNTITAPDGASTADSLLETTATGAHITTQNLTLIPGTRYTVSVYARGLNRTRLYIGASNNADTNGTGAVADLAGVRVGVAPSAYGTGYVPGTLVVSSAANSFVRLAFTFTAVDSTTKITFAIDAGSGTGPGNTSYAGNASNGVYLWGAELEPGEIAGAYLATTASSLIGVVIPASLSTPTQDAAGNALGVAGPVAKPATVEVPCVTGDGSAVYVAPATPLIPATASFDLSFWYQRNANGTGVAFDQQQIGFADSMQLAINWNGSGTLAGAWGIYAADSTWLQSSVSLPLNVWSKICINRTGNVWTLYLDDVVVATRTSASTVGQGNSTLLAYQGGASVFAAARICDLRITTGGVTRYYPLQAGPGTSNTNRDLHWVASDGTSGVVSGAIVNGTVSSIWSNRCPFARDWCIENGGGIAANGAFIPGRIGSNLDAAGNTKTLVAGKHGNPYSRLNRNRWSAPELVNIGITSSDALASNANVDTVPFNTKFRRWAADGSDRYLAVSTALTGADLTQVRSYVGASQLDVMASVGTSTSPTATGTRAVTGVGFTPKVVLPFGIGFASDGVDAAGTVLGVGAGLSSASRACVSVASNGGVTTSATVRRHTAASIVSLVSAFDSSVFLASDLTSMDAGGFTLNWSAVAGTARILNHICLGGADLEVSLTQQQMNGTNAAQSFAHGLSGAPTGVLFFSAINNNAPASTITELLMSIGAWAGSSQFGASLVSRSGVTTTATQRLLVTNGVQQVIYAGSLLRSMAVSTVDATNVNVTYPTTANSTQYYFWMLAFRGAKCQVGTFDCNGSTSPLSIATPGITPKLFLPVLVSAGVDSVGIVGAELLMGIGASDGTNNVSCGITDRNGVTTTDAKRYQSSNSLVEHALNGSKVFEATAAFSGESVVLTPTIVNSSAWGQGGFIVIGS